MLSPPSTTSSSSGNQGQTTANSADNTSGSTTVVPKLQVKVTPEQMAKLRRDLDIVQGNMAVFAEMLSELKPGQDIPPADVELLEVN